MQNQPVIDKVGQILAGYPAACAELIKLCVVDPDEFIKGYQRILRKDTQQAKDILGLIDRFGLAIQMPRPIWRRFEALNAKFLKAPPKSKPKEEIVEKPKTITESRLVRTFLVGGRKEDFTKLWPRYRSLGLELTQHAPMTSNLRSPNIPSDTEAVIILYENTHGEFTKTTKALAAKAGLPVRVVSAHFSKALPMLRTLLKELTLESPASKAIPEDDHAPNNQVTYPRPLEEKPLEEKPLEEKPIEVTESAPVAPASEETSEMKQNMTDIVQQPDGKNISQPEEPMPRKSIAPKLKFDTMTLDWLRNPTGVPVPETMQACKGQQKLFVNSILKTLVKAKERIPAKMLVDAYYMLSGATLNAALPRVQAEKLHININSVLSIKQKHAKTSQVSRKKRLSNKKVKTLPAQVKDRQPVGTPLDEVPSWMRNNLLTGAKAEILQRLETPTEAEKIIQILFEAGYFKVDFRIS